jgi:hypothetical protein
VRRNPDGNAARVELVTTASAASGCGSGSVTTPHPAWADAVEGRPRVGQRVLEHRPSARAGVLRGLRPRFRNGDAGRELEPGHTAGQLRSPLLVGLIARRSFASCISRCRISFSRRSVSNFPSARLIDRRPTSSRTTGMIKLCPQRSTKPC